MRSLEEAGISLLLMGRMKLHPSALGTAWPSTVCNQLPNGVVWLGFYPWRVCDERAASPAPERDESKHERAELLAAPRAGSFTLCIPVKSHFHACQVCRYPGAGGAGCWGCWEWENPRIVADQPCPCLALTHSTHRPACWIETLTKRPDSFLSPPKKDPPSGQLQKQDGTWGQGDN